jgi:5-methylcytosine-specific restriction endonuclease McrA
MEEIHMPYIYPFKSAPKTTIDKVWEKGKIIQGKDANVWREDACGHTIKYSDHGNTDSSYGWEIDHKKPLAKDGQNTWDNLQPLYWQTNRDKGDTYPWSC